MNLTDQIRAQLAAWQCAGLDGLVLNAASVTFRQQTTAEGLDRQWAVNYLSGFLLARELLPQMV